VEQLRRKKISAVRPWVTPRKNYNLKSPYPPFFQMGNINGCMEAAYRGYQFKFILNQSFTNSNTENFFLN